MTDTPVFVLFCYCSAKELIGSIKTVIIKRMKKKVIIRILVILVIIILVVYAVVGNLIVEAALVPSFMTKLDAFEKATDQSYSEMVHTDDVTENTRQEYEKTVEWFNSAPKEKLTTESSDGYTLVAAVFPNDESHSWALLLHGYTGYKEEQYHHAMHFHEEGYNVLVPDMRCQGESEGDYIGLGYTDSADNMLWLGYILEQDPDAEIVIHGESMGAACALMMSAREDLPHNVKCIISDCAFTDALTVFRGKMKDWLGIPDLGFVSSARLCLLARGGYDVAKASALDAVNKSDVPTLFIHGTEDKFVPHQMEDLLYDACTAEKDIVKIEGAGHVQSCYKDPETYYRTVFGFIDKYIK